MNELIKLAAARIVLEKIALIGATPKGLQQLAQLAFRAGKWTPKWTDTFNRLAKRLDPKDWQKFYSARGDIAFGKAPTNRLRELFRNAGIFPTERI
jgi:hypothetical protein